MRFKCSNCGDEFDESKLFIPISGFGLLCGVCFQIDARESYGDMISHVD